MDEVPVSLDELAAAVEFALRLKVSKSTVAEFAKARSETASKAIAAAVVDHIRLRNWRITRETRHMSDPGLLSNPAVRADAGPPTE
jgi:hypothetical protein